MDLTVIVTAERVTQFAPQALDSLEKQKLRGFEVLLLDTRQNEALSALFTQRAKHNKLWRVVAAPGASVAACRNAGVLEASGRYISFLDAKDTFPRSYLAAMLDTARRYNASLTVGRMRGFDVFGQYAFSATDALSRRRVTNRFDPSLIWNPSVSNKLFLRERILQQKLEFQELSLAQEALFSLGYALEGGVIACAQRGFAEFRNLPFAGHPWGDENLHDYLYAYAQIRQLAREAITKAAGREKTEFARQELEQQGQFFLDEIYAKLLTVILYRYYRRVHTCPQELWLQTVTTVEQLLAQLSPAGRERFIITNADLFLQGCLPVSAEQMKRQTKLTIVLSGLRSREELHAQLQSIWEQSLPFFNLLIAENLRPLMPREIPATAQLCFLPATDVATLRTAALEQATTPYLIFLDEPCLLAPKILLEHYRAIHADKTLGFTTSPLSRYDGAHFELYKSATLAFYTAPKARRSEDSGSVALDLRFCNKLLRVSHLRGIKFAFSEDSALDVYKLYQNASYRKLQQSGIYLPLAEEQALETLQDCAPLLPPGCRSYLRRYKRYYLRTVALAEQQGKAVARLKLQKRFWLDRCNHAFQWLYRRLPLKERTLFYTIRTNGRMTENMQELWDGTPGEKKLLAYLQPHPLRLKPKLYYYLMTSKIIVTDDYVRYLRAFRLREGQKVLQVWHACGAFKRFSLDAPLPRTRLEELKTHSQYSAVAVSSEHARQFYAHAFGISEKTVLATGIPRTDALLDKQMRAQLRERMLHKHPLLKGKRVYLYCPTFREQDGAVVPFDPQINWKLLNASLAEDEIFILKNHPVMRENYLQGKHYTRLRDYSREPTAELLSVCDVLVTDYSSLLYDACLMRIPTVFYCPDLAHYERSFYLAYPKDLPGPAVQDAALLPELLRMAAEQPPFDKIAAFSSAQIGACDGHSTQRVLALLASWRNER